MAQAIACHQRHKWLKAMSKLRRFGDYLYSTLLAGSSDTPNERRREFVLHVLLLASASVCFIAAVLAAFDYPHVNQLQQGNTVYNTTILAVIMAGLYYLSRMGRHIIAAYVFLGSIGLAMLSLALKWSYELPTAELGCALLIMLAGMILSTRAAVRWSLSIGLLYLGVALAQIFGLLYCDTSWLKRPLELANAIDYGLILGVITLVSLLANMEIANAFRRANRNRLKLLFERDQLEQRVAERTAEIERIQAEHLLELQRYAEFGRINAHLLHDITSPLTAALINLQQLNKTDSPALRQTRKSLRQLERYVHAARKQLQYQSEPIDFSVGKEIKQLLVLLKPLADTAQAKLVLECDASVTLHGDQIRFNHIIANLVANAIDACVGTIDRAAIITITVEDLGRYLKVSVADTGKGIGPAQLPQIFQPFYTTKQAQTRGLGIGLSIVKQSVTTDFHGTICANSSVNSGTTFTILLKSLQAAT